MKTNTIRLCLIDGRYRLSLFIAVLGFITLLPSQKAGAQVASDRVADEQPRNSNGDRLPLPDAAEYKSQWRLSDWWLMRAGRDWLDGNIERARADLRRPNGTNGVSTWTGGSGNWSNAGMWSPSGFPNASDADVFVDGGNTGMTSVVTVDGSFGVGRITIDTGDTVAVGNNIDFRVSSTGFVGAGNIVNNGTFSLNATGNSTRLVIQGTAGVTLSGTGTFIMNGGANQISGDSFGGIFINQSTIQGTGNIGADIINPNNQGLIDANLAFTGSNSIYLDATSTFTNSGTLRASNGGLLQLGASAYANTGGTILATGTGSIVQIENSASISNGTLSATAGGLIRSASGASVTLSGVSITGNYQGTNNSDTYLVGTITNSGTITLNPAGNNARLIITSAGATLVGGGNVILGGSGAGVISGNAFSALLTNQANTISGVGNIGNNIIDINNQSLIDANVPFTGSNVLVLDPVSTLTNTGTLRASNGGLLDLGGGAYANAGGTILATGTGSIVQLDNSSAISGGILATSLGGIIQTGNGLSTSLDNVTNSGTYQALNNSTTRISGTITNSGSITLRAAGNSVSLIVPGGAGSNTILTGGGSIILDDSLGTNNQIRGDSFGNILTNQNNTISGVGNIGTDVIDIVNQSLIDANVPFATASHLLVLDPLSTLTNTGTLRASNGGLLDLGGGTYTNTGGTILATGAGSIVQLDNQATVSGGTLTTSGGGVVQTGDGKTVALNNVSNTGTYLALNNSDTRISGTINNSGTMTLKAVGNAVRFVVPGAAGSTTVLTGGGSIILSDTLGTNNQITGDNFGNILTNQNQTISGVGNIGVNVLDINNQSLIDANVPFSVASHVLLLDPTTTLTNTGTLRASNGGFLNLGGGTYANTSGTILATGVGSIVQLDNQATVSGGTLATSGGGIIQTGDGKSVSLDNISNTGSYQALNNSDTTISGTINNSGTMTLRAVGNAVRFVVPGASGANTILSGGGNIIFDDTLGTNNQITGQNTGNILTNQNNTISGAGNIGVNVLDLVNGGVINADRANNLVIDPSSTFMNNTGGILRGSGAGGLFLAGATYTNNGTFEALNGSSVFMNTDTTLTNNLAGVLTGGTYRAIATGGGATLTIRGSNITQIAANTEVDLSGAGSVFQNATTSIESTLLSNLGILRILGNRNYTNTNALSNGGTLELGGGIFDAPGLTNTGELFGFGTVTPRPTNSGLIRAVGGILAFTNGIQGGSGTVQVDATGVLNLSSSSLGSSADFLANNGNANPSLLLGSQNFMVGLDYTNSHFGSGNTFNPRANVSGTGFINAAGNVAQTLSGNLANGTTTTPTMAFGNVHVGDNNTRNFQVNNTGSNGPSLRGALQTSVNGGNISDGRLSGSGVTASNFGPLALGGNTGNLAVTFNATSAGALTAQILHVINNFDNVQEQDLSITGAAYRFALPTAHAPEPINFGNFHVGDTAPGQVLSITNNVPNDGFSEALNATIGGATGGVTTNGGSFSLLLPNATNNTSLSVGISTATAGSKNGTATITLASDGQGSSGLGITSLMSQTVNVTGTVFRLAAPSMHTPEPINFGVRHVGDTVANVPLSVTNNAPNDTFSESLNGSIGTSSTGLTTSGSFTGLAPGSTNNTSLGVGIDTTSAGLRNGTATIALQSNGTGSSGLGNTNLTSQTVNVTGQVNFFADPVLIFKSGSATLVMNSPTSFTLNFGQVAQNSGTYLASFGVSNSLHSANFQDSLGGTFDVTAVSNFILSGFGPFSGVASGAALDPDVSFNSSQPLGSYSNAVTLAATSTNASGTSNLGPITLNLQGQIIVVPEPSTWMLLIAGAALLFACSRIRRRGV